MPQIIYSDLETLENLKSELDSGVISASDVPQEYVNILNVLYKIEIQDAQKEIEEMKLKIDDYKNRMRAAIEYLKNKNKF